MSQAQHLRKTPRQSQYDINPLLLHRWSPRAMSGEEISDSELMRLFEWLDGLPHPTTANHGDLFILKETLNPGINYSA